MEKFKKFAARRKWKVSAFLSYNQRYYINTQTLQERRITAQDKKLSILPKNSSHLYITAL